VPKVASRWRGGGVFGPFTEALYEISNGDVNINSVSIEGGDVIVWVMKGLDVGCRFFGESITGWGLVVAIKDGRCVGACAVKA
jgi:hypothetical protein